jgi:hypothetical protein
VARLQGYDLAADAVSPDKLPRSGNKFNVAKAEDRMCDGIKFASKWEARVYRRLKDTVPDGMLHLQPAFQLQEGFRARDGEWQRPITYVADFLIGPPRGASSDPLLEEHIVIDAKGMRTDVFMLKRKMLLKLYNPARFIELRLVRELEDLCLIKPWNK